ncbi:bifunctional metallophosphatase/5'-nucleotidase [Mycoplasmopsis alligatoris]|uniref:5'-nucleotidase, C-terminal domain protein n=1 Tax=Mycoplasmopsis alligatoris A21JP2 TaxID=747682 RepID=D4XWV1_9BACT|nr:bifunctional UDP-sugar hydrolase/5'-nucleotidase [Mycoplasmopsis alligatoris]EFF41132.1 5'-nucleotidase, C-terminal domain protein [Mycoplasmopsis alligatoris A21JP2]
MRFKKIMLLGSITPILIATSAITIACNTTTNNTGKTEEDKKDPVVNKESLEVARVNYKNAMEAYNTKLSTYAKELKAMKVAIDKNKKDEALKTSRKEFVASKESELKELRSKINTTFKALNLAEKDSDTQTLKIFHTNDEHGRLKFDDGKYNNYSGMDTLAEFLENVEYTLLLSAGDLIQGLPLSDSDKGKTISLVAKEMKYDAIAIGNHEFDFGLDHMLELNKATSSTMPFLSANVVYNDKVSEDKKGKLPFKPYIIKEVANGFKVGIMGITTPDTTITSHPNNSKDVLFNDPVESSNKTVSEIRDKEKVNFVIALTHLGIGRNIEKWDSNYFAKNALDVDLVLDGHSHNKVDIAKKDGDQAYLTQTEAYTQYLGEIDLVVNKKTGKIESVTQSLRDINEVELAAFGKKNDNVKNLIKDLETKFGVENNKVAFKNTVVFDHVTLQNVDGTEFWKGRVGQTNLGLFAANAIADEVVKAKKDDSKYNADTVIGLMNGGGLRANIAIGDVTRGQALGVLPFGNRISAVKVEGDTLKAAIMHAGSKMKSGAFGQFSSNVKFNIVGSGEGKTKKYAVEEASIKINGKDIVATNEYTIVTNDFLLAGGDGYVMLKYADKSKNVTLDYEGGDLLDVLINHAVYTSNEANFGDSKTNTPFAHKMSFYGEASSIKNIVVK